MRERVWMSGCVPNLWDEFAMDGDVIEPTRSHPRMTRSQRRQHCRERVNSPPVRQEIHELQAQDEELQWLVEQDKTGRFVQTNGVWTRMHRGCDGTEVKQVLLPHPFRLQVLKIAHQVPIAGHMGRDRTAQWILRRFYWPSLFKDITEYCQSCEACQKTAKGQRIRAPLIPMPIMGKPFERVAMDIVGPLPKTKSGHRYILVLVDYMTCYPEAIPLKTVTVEVIAEKLVDVCEIRDTRDCVD